MSMQNHACSAVGTHRWSQVIWATISKVLYIRLDSP